MTDQNMTRPEVLERISETQLSEIENQFDENDRGEFNTIAQSYDWDEQTCDQVWNWLAQGRRHEGFEGSPR